MIFKYKTDLIYQRYHCIYYYLRSVRFSKRNKKLFSYKFNFICDLKNVNTCIVTAYFCRLLAFQSTETKLKQIKWFVIFVAVYSTSLCICLTAYNFFDAVE